MRVAFRTFGCKANQYDGERMRQEVEARGAGISGVGDEADVCVVNTCTVTNQADAEARRFIRRLHRDNPRLRVVVAGCSAALRAPEYRKMPGVTAVVAGHDPVAVAQAVESGLAPPDAAAAPPDPTAVPTDPDPAPPDPPVAPPDPDAAPLVQLGTRRSLDSMDQEPVGGEILLHRGGATRGWLKIQDGCDRKCSFCATRLARGESRSRHPEEVVREARALASTHPELVLTGIHIGHYGLDLEAPCSLSRLLALLLDRVPLVRFRLGSIEATEVDDLLVELLVRSDGRVAPHLHMPLQSGADPVLRRMRRWHTREMYRRRTLEIAERLSGSGPVLGDGFPVLGLGADIITGFPGETDEDHRATLELVEELPYTYLHVFPFSPRERTVAAELNHEMPVPQRVAGERSKELRDIVQAKEAAYRRKRAGNQARIVIEREGRSALTEDYLRVSVKGPLPEDHRGLHDVELGGVDGELSAVFSRAWRRAQSGSTRGRTSRFASGGTDATRPE